MYLKSGQPFPIANPTDGQNGSLFFMDGAAFSFVSWLTNPTDLEIDAWRSGDYLYGAFVEDAVPFLLVGFTDSDLLVDASINIVAELKKGEALCDFLAGDSDLLNLILVDAQTNITCAIRKLGMGPTTANALRAACIQQVELYEKGEDVAKKIYALMRQYSPIAMFQKTQMYRPV